MVTRVIHVGGGDYRTCKSVGRALLRETLPVEAHNNHLLPIRPNSIKKTSSNQKMIRTKGAVGIQYS